MPSRSRRARSQETGIVGAYEAFSRGVINLRTETYESLERAIMLFERAVELDPRYARAHLELGAAYATKADYLAMDDLRVRAMAGLRRALDLQPDSVRALRELGSVLIAMDQETEGFEALHHALELDPADAGALGAMARALFRRAQLAKAANVTACRWLRIHGGCYLAGACALRRASRDSHAVSGRAAAIALHSLSIGAGMLPIEVVDAARPPEALQPASRAVVHSPGSRSPRLSIMRWAENRRRVNFALGGPCLGQTRTGERCSRLPTSVRSARASRRRLTSRGITPPRRMRSEATRIRRITFSRARPLSAARSRWRAWRIEPSRHTRRIHAAGVAGYCVGSRENLGFRPR